MITVHGRRSSINVQKVLWTLGELGRPFERRTVGGSFGGNREPAYLALNPMGLVPVLVDGEVTMFESNAIVRYLAARYGQGSLRPAQPAALAAAEQWMEWQQITVYPLIATIFMGLVRTAPEQRDEAAIRDSVLKLPAALAIADKRLGEVPWFAGDHFSMGDIVMGCLMWRYSQLDIDRPATPHIDRWFKALQARQPYRDWVMVPVGSSPQEWLKNERELQ